jgi:hypothetical protein
VLAPRGDLYHAVQASPLKTLFVHFAGGNKPSASGVGNTTHGDAAGAGAGNKPSASGVGSTTFGNGRTAVGVPRLTGGLASAGGGTTGRGAGGRTAGPVGGAGTNNIGAPPMGRPQPPAGLQPAPQRAGTSTSQITVPTKTPAPLQSVRMGSLLLDPDSIRE